MKYLKTYEEKIPMHRYAELIKEWMQKNKLEKIDLSNYNITFCMHKKILEIFFDSSLMVEYKFPKYPSSRYNYMTFLESLYSEVGAEIFQILQEMTPEEIEEQRAKNEAEKFNF